MTSKNDTKKDNYYRLLAENSRDIIMTQNLRGEIVYVNPAWADVTNYSIEETQGKSFSSFVSPKYNNNLVKHYAPHKAGKEDIYEIEIISKSGEKIPIEIRYTPITLDADEFEETLLIMRDLRERKITQKILAKSEEHYRTLFESTPISLWEDDFSAVKEYLDTLKKNGVSDFQQYFLENPLAIDKCIRLVEVIDVNQASVFLNKAKSKSDLLSRAGGLFTKRSKLSFQEGLVSLINGEKLVSFQTNTIALNGEEIHQTMQWKILSGYEKNWKRVIVSVQDLSVLKQAQDSLSISEASYQNLFNSIDDAIYVQDREGHFLDVNEGAVKLYGIPKEEFIGKTPLFLSATGKNNLDDIAKKIESAFVGEAQEFEFWGKRINGEIFLKDVRVYKGVFLGKDVVIALSRDITRRKNTEVALRHQLDELNILQATAYASTQASNPKDTIRQITNIIGNTLYPDNFGILLLDKDTGMLHPHSSYQGADAKEVYKSNPFSKGITGKVITTGKALRFGDVSKSTNYIEFSSSTRSELCVPLKVGGEILGVINAESSKKDFFTVDAERLLTTIAGQTALALEKFHLLEVEKKRRQIAEKLQKSAAILTTTLNREKAIELILKELLQVVSFDSASVQLLRKGYLKIVGGRGTLVLDKEKNRRFLYPGDNPNTRVIQTGLPLILKNAPKAYPAFLEMPSIQSWLGVPLIAQDNAIGILALDSGKLDHFTDEDAQLVQSFANHAAIAIQNATLFNAEKTRRKESDTLRETTLAVTSSLNLAEAVERILKQLRRVLPYDSASVQILENNELVIFGGHGWLNPADVKELRFSLDGSNPNTRVIRKKEILILGDAQAEHAPFRSPPHNHIHSWMGVPLIIRDSVVGMLAIDSKEKGYFTEENAKVAQSFAYPAAIAIENAHLYADALDSANQHAVLHHLSQDILRDIESSEKTYQAIHRAAEKLMPCDVFVIEIREEKALDDDSVYLIDKNKRYRAKKVPRESSLIFLSEKAEGSFIDKILPTEDTQLRENTFGSKGEVRSRLVSPMRIGKKLIGVLSAQSYTPDIYDEKEKVLLEMLASHAASAIENARLFYETVQRGKEFAEIYSITQDLATFQEMDTLLKTTLNRAALLLGVSCGDIYLYDSKTELLNPAINYGLPKEYAQKVQSLSIPKGEGMAGYIAETLKTFQVDDYRTWDRQSPQHQNFNITSILGVPMLYAGNLIGVMVFYETHPNTHHFTESDKRVMSLFATQVAGAVHSTKQFEQINNRLIELEAINHTSTALRIAENAEDILSVLLNETRKSLGIEVASIWLNDSKTNEIYRALACGWIKDIKSDRQKNDLGLIGHVYQSGESYTTSNLKDNPYVKLAKDESFPANWVGAWVPIRSTDSIIGVIAIMAGIPRKFTKDDLRLLTTLAEIAGSAIQRAHFHRHTEKQVKRLTALRNIDAAISANFDLQITLQILVDHTVSQLGVDAASILLITPPSEDLAYFVGSGFATKAFSNIILKDEETILSKAIQKRRLQHTTSLFEDRNSIRNSWFLAENFHSYYCAPLIAKGEVLGVLEVFHRETLSPSPEWEDFLQALAAQAAIAIDNDRLIESLAHSNKELSLAYDITLEGWGKALGLRDEDTLKHTENVAELTLQLAREIGISEENLAHIHRGALLHDVGKMGIPDNILRKPGPLTKKEWEIMKQHPQLAYDMISPIPYLLPALDIPYCHHERWDGNGYPRGLKGDDIPLAARIFTIVDVWDALLSDRPYREAWEKKTVLDYIQNESGSRFDPKIVDVFIKMVSSE